MPIISANKADLFVSTQGQGDPVLMICGMISDVASWTPLSPLLNEKFSLMSFDNRGTGRTNCQSQNWTIDDMVEDAICVLDHYQIERAHIIGHSMGGMIGLRVTQRFPDRVGAFAMMSSVNAPNDKGIAYFADMAKLYASDMDKSDWFERLFKVLYSPPFFENPAHVKAAAQTAAAYAHAQTPQNLFGQVAALASIKPIEIEGIATPTLALIGDNDKIVLPHRTRASLERHPDLTIKNIAGAAHSIHWEAPQEVANAITEFFIAHPL